MFERPVLLWLLALAPLVAINAAFMWQQGLRIPIVLSAICRITAFAALVLMLAGFRIPGQGKARHLTVIAVLDQSRSIAPDQADWMRSQIEGIRRAMSSRDRFSVVGFGRDARLLGPLEDPRLFRWGAGSADPGATDISGALTTSAGLFPPETEKRLVLLTDGNENQGKAAQEAPAIADLGVRIFTFKPPPSKTERIALTDFAAVREISARTSFAFRLGVQSETREPVTAHLKLFSDGINVGESVVTLKPGFNRFELPYRIDKPGAYLMDAQLDVPPPAVVINPRAETAVTVIDPPKVLVSSNMPPESLLAALRLRHYQIVQIPPRRLPQRAQGYLPYQAVIIADAPAASLSVAAQQALNRYVAQLGGGLIVTGGALRDDRFAKSPLEKALPISFRPQPPPPGREPLAIYLCIDRSNSMSYNSRYPAVRDGERIRYAKQAALALMGQLEDTDYVGVVAFDSQPYVLSHLRPLGEGREELENRVSRIEPGGGTDFKEALETAEREIVDSGLKARQVILITDGDTNRQYHDHDALIADLAARRIPVSTIRIGPDLANLQLLEDLAQMTNGLFYRVEDIEKLPQLLVRMTRKATNRHRSERVRVRYRGHSSILHGIGAKEIPPLEFFITTEAREGASVPLEIERGEESFPLLAAWQYGLGRSAIFAADTDSFTALRWIQWDRYAEFWSQAIAWVMRPGGSGAFDLRVSTAETGGLRLQAEQADAAPVSDLVCRIVGPHRVSEIAMTQTGPSLYEGEAAPLPRGKYMGILMRKAGDVEQVLGSRSFAVADPAAVEAPELQLRPANLALLRSLSAQTGGGFDQPVSAILKRTGATVTIYHSVEAYLLPLVIALILGEALIRQRFFAL